MKQFDTEPACVGVHEMLDSKVLVKDTAQCICIAMFYVAIFGAPPSDWNHQVGAIDVAFNIARRLSRNLRSEISQI